MFIYVGVVQGHIKRTWQVFEAATHRGDVEGHEEPPPEPEGEDDKKKKTPGGASGSGGDGAAAVLVPETQRKAYKMP